jgi:hypothetical protein
MDDIFYKKKLKYASLKKSIKNDTSLISVGTIDIIHTKYINEFNKQNKDLLKYQNKINKLKLELKQLDNIFPINYTYSDINKKSILKDEIEEYEELINKINLYNDELDYFFKSLPILEQYYCINRNINIIEINNNNNININSNSNSNSNSNNLLDIFKNYKKENIEDTILEEYLKCASNKIIKNKNNILNQLCPICYIEKSIQPSEGYLVCLECGHSDQVIIDTEKINFKEPFYENKNSGYKKMNHFSELMNQFQAKESTDINPEIFKMIIIEIKKQKITNPLHLKKKKMREILKKLELNQYFEHIPFIINKLTGLQPPTITREYEEKIKTMFKKIQYPFELYRPKYRKNFLNYNYVFYKFFELLDLDHFLPHFPLLKSINKLREQDEIWENICKYLKWQYISSH